MLQPINTLPGFCPPVDEYDRPLIPEEYREHVIVERWSGTMLNQLLGFTRFGAWPKSVEVLFLLWLDANAAAEGRYTRPREDAV